MKGAWWAGALLFLGGCRTDERSLVHLPKSLHTKLVRQQKFDEGRWRLERIPSFRDTEISVRASMADDVLKQMRPGIRITEVMSKLDEPNRVELREDALPAEAAFFGTRGFVILSYPVVVDDTNLRHTDLQFLFDRSGMLLSSRKASFTGQIRLGP